MRAGCLSVLGVFASAVLGVWVVIAGVGAASGAMEKTDSLQADNTAEKAVRSLYDLITFDAGAPPAWSDVADLFLEDAHIVLRTGRDGHTVFSRDEFVQDFTEFSQRDVILKNGFQEKIIKLKAMEFGDIAHVLVLYEASIPNVGRPAQQGLDSFHLARMDGDWLIVSIVNEIIAPGRPIPAVLQDD